MANVITGAEYSQLATQYAYTLRTLGGASAYLFNALQVIANLNDIDPTVDLIVPFNTVYIQQSGTLGNGGQFLQAVRALNNHVLARATTHSGAAYTDINDWFTDQDIAGSHVGFPIEWANMCALAGVDVHDFVM